MNQVVSYFINNQWTQHNDVVYEAEGFFDPKSCEALIGYMRAKNSSCVLHDHAAHVQDTEKEDTFFWRAECFNYDVNYTPVEDYNLSSFHGISKTVHSMNDAANRYTLKPMKLAKVIFHRYGPGAAGPEHSDVYPLATLLYLNDNYEGGEIYFSSGLELKPRQGSLLAFDGGGVNRHGVRQNTGDTARYVLVAFWEYEEEDDLVKFWNLENMAEDEKNNTIDAMIKRKSGHDSRASIMHAETFPILRVDNFLSLDEADNIIKYLDLNDINPEETWGPVCFREYWEKAYPDKSEEQPQYIPGVDENTLSDINRLIRRHVHLFMEMQDGDLAFSKFKGHNHVQGAFSPPHTHPPAVVVAQVVLHDQYEGGNIVIPAYDIEFRAMPHTLYVYSEENDLKHGITKVTSGDRQSLVSHWQSKNHVYDKAGANV